MPNTAKAITESKPRYVALDGLRGIAAVLVILFHVKWSNHITNNAFVDNSYLAVDLFFILSGLVIASNYSDRLTEWRKARSFLILRFFRLYPIHIAVLAVLVSLEFAKMAAIHLLGIPPGGQPPFKGTNSITALIANIFLLQGWHVLGELTWNGPSWSISCEFFAYWIFALIALLGLHLRNMFFIIVAPIALAGYGTIAILYNSLDVSTDWGFIRCLSGFFLGMLIFRLAGRATALNQRYARSFQIPAVAATILVLCTAPGALIAFIVPLFFITVLLLVPDEGPVANILKSKHLQFLGRISYSVYMVHDVFLICILIAFKQASIRADLANPVSQKLSISINPWIGDLLVLGMIGLIIATATGTYILIEQPGRRLGRKIIGAIDPEKVSSVVQPQQFEASAPAGPS